MSITVTKYQLRFIYNKSKTSFDIRQPKTCNVTHLVSELYRNNSFNTFKG